MTETDKEYVEPDAVWFDPKWLLDHPEFPLDPRMQIETDPLEEV